MKIAAATTRGGLDDVISPVFGRCPTFTLVDVEDGEVLSHEVVENPYAGAMGGAGIQAAQLIISKSAQAILAGAFGPNASNVFSQGGVQMVPAQGPVKEKALEFASGRLTPASGPTVEAFAGRGVGTGAGMGMGRGTGMGRGGGMGRGMGMNGGAGMAGMSAPTAQPPATDAMAGLVKQVRGLTSRLEELTQRIDALERRKT